MVQNSMTYFTQLFRLRSKCFVIRKILAVNLLQYPFELARLAWQSAKKSSPCYKSNSLSIELFIGFRGVCILSKLKRFVSHNYYFRL